MRAFALALLFALHAVAQPPDFSTPKTYPPDDATLTKINDKTEALRLALATSGLIDSAVYLKAAEWIVAW